MVGVLWGLAAIAPPVPIGNDPIPWSIGAGYFVVDVVAMSADKVVINVSIYVESGLGSPPKYSNSTSYIGPPSVGVDLYIHPDLLRDLIKLHNPPNVKVVRLPYELNNTTYQAVQQDCQ